MVAALLFLWSGSVVSGDHQYQSESATHCAAGAAAYQAWAQSQGVYPVSSSTCVHYPVTATGCTAWTPDGYCAGYYACQKTQNGVTQSAQCETSRSAGIGAVHKYDELDPACDENNPEIPGSLECTWPNCGANDMEPLTVCDNGCVYYAGPSDPDDCSYEDTNENAGIDDGETMACNVSYFPAGGENNTCETGASIPGVPGAGTTPCSTTNCAGDTSGGGSTGGGTAPPSTGAGEPTIPDGNPPGDAGTNQPIPGDNDGDGVCEAGEDCASAEGQGDLLGEILREIRGDGTDTGDGAQDYAGSGGDQNEEMVGDEAGKDYGKAGKLAIEASGGQAVNSIGDGLEVSNFGGACPVFSWASSTGHGSASVNTSEAGYPLRALFGFVLWIFVGLFGWFHLYKSIAG